MLKDVFYNLLGEYTSDNTVITSCWEEIEKSYGNKKRHYHNLLHLENLFAELIRHKDQIAQWNVTLFALFYHDVVYNTLKQDNEERSAVLAAKRLSALNVPPKEIELCVEMINATKGHDFSANADVNLFTDADLSILGKDWEVYKIYFENIRKEYAIYPDLIYKPGRKKVLQHFLAMKSIFKTEAFYGKYEKAARENLERELNN